MQILGVTNKEHYDMLWYFLESSIGSLLGSFSNDDSDGNQDVKKAIGLLRKTPTLHVHHAFLYIS